MNLRPKYTDKETNLSNWIHQDFELLSTIARLMTPCFTSFTINDALFCVQLRCRCTKHRQQKKTIFSWDQSSQFLQLCSPWHLKLKLKEVLDEMLQKLFFFFLFFSQEEEDDHESWFCLFFKLQQYLLAGFSAKLSCFDDNVDCLIWEWKLIANLLNRKKPFLFLCFWKKEQW